MRAFLLGSIALSLLGSVASANDVALKASHDAAGANFFTLDFGDGNPRNAQISNTVFDLRIDEASGTARFVNYHQLINPIEIPLGNGQSVSTGDITVTVVPGSSTGVFNSETGVFSTAELYEISFTGDLSFIGFTSPVVLPSASNGTITYSSATAGGIDQIWDGETTVGVFQLAYQCRVTTAFVEQYPGDLNCDAAVGASDISAFVLALSNPSGFGGAFPGCDITMADINGDGSVTVGDIGAFVGLLTN